MARLKFGVDVDIRWNGYNITGPANTEFTIPDQLYEEFEEDFRAVEPSLTWVDTNEFATLAASVSVSTLSATAPIALASTSTGKTISFSSGTALNGYLLAADGSGGSIWNPASTSGLTSVVGVSPISTTISGGVASVILDASYQTAGTYVNAVIGASPASVVTASGTSTVSIDQAAITGATAAENAQTVRTYVKNTTGTTIPKGSAVYISGATGDNALISLATASTEAGSSKTLGITAESIDTDAFGYVVESGYLTGIDTTGISAGTSVWLGNTPGSLVFGTPPAEPSHSVYLGVVIREQQNNGSILVKVQNGYELDELHDVSAASPSDGDIIQYKTSSNLWTKASIANAGIAASSHTHDYQVSGNYQTAGTYVNAVIGTSPASVSTASGTATVSISSGTSESGSVLTSDGSGGATFSSPIISVNSTTLSGSGTWVIPSGVTYLKAVLMIEGGGGGASGELVSNLSATDNARGGNSGSSGAIIYAENIYVGYTTSITYSVGQGGPGASATGYTKVSGSSTTTTLARSNGQKGTDSTFGSLMSTASEQDDSTVPTIYWVDNQTPGASSQTGSSGSTATIQHLQNWLLNPSTNKRLITQFTHLGYAHFASILASVSSGADGGSGSISVSGNSATGASGAGGAGGATSTTINPAAGGASGTTAGSNTTANDGAAGVRHGAGGGGGAKARFLDINGTVNSILGGNGGNGRDIIGGGGGGGGGVQIYASNSNPSNFSTLTVTSASGGNGGNGGNGTIIIWY